MNNNIQMNVVDKPMDGYVLISLMAFGTFLISA